MATANIDLELDCIDDRDLVDEIVERIRFRRLPEKQLNRIKEALAFKNTELLHGVSLLDQMKMEAIIPNLWRKSPQDIESFFTA